MNRNQDTAPVARFFNVSGTIGGQHVAACVLCNWRHFVRHPNALARHSTAFAAGRRHVLKAHADEVVAEKQCRAEYEAWEARRWASLTRRALNPQPPPQETRP